jgi:hypothetical protein
MYRSTVTFKFEGVADHRLDVSSSPLVLWCLGRLKGTYALCETGADCMAGRLSILWACFQLSRATHSLHLWNPKVFCCIHVSVTGPRPGSHVYPARNSTICYFNVILSSMHGYAKSSLLFMIFWPDVFMRLSYLVQNCMFNPSHPPWFVCPPNSWWRARIMMNVLVVWFSPSCHF